MPAGIHPEVEGAGRGRVHFQRPCRHSSSRASGRAAARSAAAAPVRASSSGAEGPGGPGGPGGGIRCAARPVSPRSPRALPCPFPSASFPPSLSAAPAPFELARRTPARALMPSSPHTSFLSSPTVLVTNCASYTANPFGHPAPIADPAPGLPPRAAAHLGNP